LANAYQLISIEQVDGLAAALDAAGNTPAEILASLLTVDGPGSGLNADLFDGYNSTDFVFTSSYTAADVLSKLITVDGSGSGLDADLFDGYNSDAFPRKAETATISGSWSFSTGYIHGIGTTARLDLDDNFGASLVYGTSRLAVGGPMIYYIGGVEKLRINLLDVAFESGTITANGNSIWHAGNDGAASGLDSDLLDGQHGSYYLNAGNLNAGTLLAARMPALTGDITTSAGAVATTLATVNGNVGSFGSATAAAVFTVNAKGLITAASSTTITPAFSSITSKPTTLSGYGITDAMPLAGGTFTGNISIVKATPAITINDTTYVNPSPLGLFRMYSAAGNLYFTRNTSTARDYATESSILNMNSSTGVVAFVSGPFVGANQIWHAGNDGTGSTMDADLLDGQEGSYYRDAGNLNAGTILAARMPAHTGDVTSSAASVALTLATVNGNVGSFGSATAASTFTVNAKGLITAAGSTTITPAWGSITSVPAGVTSLAALTGAGVVTATSTGVLAMRSIGVAGSTEIPDRAAADSRYLTLAGGTLTGYLVLHADPASAMQPATKQYVDNLASGLSPKTAARVATTVAGGNITLSGTQTIDGVAVIAGNRVLVKNQTSSLENGLYVCAAGAWSRATDADSWAELVSAFVFVEEGTDNADTGWTCTVNSGGTLNTTAVTWVQFSGSATFTASTGITKVGSDFQLTGQALALHNLATNGSIHRTGSGTYASRTLTAPAAGITVTNGDGVSGNPTLVLANDLAAVEGLATTGIVRRTATDTWSASALVNADLPASGVTASTYRSVTVNAQGIVTGGTNPTTISGYGITDLLTSILAIDGASSGIDADLLDGQHGSYYQDAGNINAGTLSDSRLPSTMTMKTFSGSSGGTTPLSIVISDTHTATQTTTTPWAALDFTTADISGVGAGVRTRIGAVSEASSGANTKISFFTAPTTAGTMVEQMSIGSQGPVTITSSTITAAGNAVWHAGNDGASSTLDADLLDGQHGSYYQNAGNLNAGTILAARMPALTGDITTSAGAVATTLATVNGNVGSFGSATAATIFTVNAKGLITAASSATITPAWSSITSKPTTISGFGITDAVTRASFAVSPNSSVAAIDSRAITNPTTGLGYSGGGRFRFSALNDDNTTPYADVIDLSTYTDSSGGGFNALYFSKSSHLLKHKFAAAGATSWDTKTIAYTDSAMSGNTTGSAGSLANGRTISITGDLAWTSPSFNGSSNISAAGTLATVNGNVGSFGSATAATIFTVNAKGLITAASSATITPAWSSITSKPTTLSGYSVTAADVLSTLLTVDGASSALDADLLDGQQGSYYQNASNINAGTISDSYLPTTMSGKTFTGNLDSTNGADRSLTLRSSTSYNWQLISTGDHFQIREASDAAKIRLAITYPNGYVGIGTASPGSVLELFNAATFNARTSGLNVHRPSSYGQYGSMAYDGDTTYFSSTYTGGGAGVYGAFRFWAYDSTSTPVDRFMIAANGNVGINVTDPAYQLEVSKTTGGTMAVSTAGQPGTTASPLITTVNFLGYLDKVKAAITAEDRETNVLGGWMNFHTMDTSNVSQKRVTIDPSGNLGFGIAAPLARLHSYRDTANATASLIIEEDGLGDASLSFLLTGVIQWSMGLDNSDSDKFKISASSTLGTTDYFSIDGSGNVGINTASPGQSFGVNVSREQVFGVDTLGYVTMPHADASGFSALKAASGRGLRLMSGSSTLVSMPSSLASTLVLGYAALQIGDSSGSGTPIRLFSIGASDLVLRGGDGDVSRTADVIVTVKNNVEVARFADTGVVSFANTSVTAAGNAMWHAGNDGAASGLDADLLDGVQGASYALLASPALTGTPTAPTAAAATNTTQIATTAFVTTADNLKANIASPSFTGNGVLTSSSGGTTPITFTISDTHTATQTTTTPWAAYDFTSADLSGVGAGVRCRIGAVSEAASGANTKISFFTAPTTAGTMVEQMSIGSQGPITFTSSTVTAAGNAVWHAGNDGAGSGLDADLLDGQSGSYYQNAGNLNAGTILAARMPALTGDITTSAGAVATTLATVNGNVGSFGSATAAATFTVNAKGLITAAGSTTITPAFSSITSKPTTLSGYGITDAMPLSGGTFTGNISIVKASPSVTINDTTYVNPSTVGLFRYYSAAGNLYFTRNTSTARDYATESSIMVMNGTDGSVTFGNNVSMPSFSVTSDERLKTSIKELEGYSDFIDATKVYSFVKDDRHQFGVMAHEAQEVRPEMVSSIEHAELGEVLTVNPMDYLFALVAEVQDLRKRVAQLEGK